LTPKLKKKSRMWLLTFPFAHKNYTALGKTLYYPRSIKPEDISESTIKHEAIHLRQQAEVGYVKYLFKYLFCFPFFRNDFRYKMEMEAYKEGNNFYESHIHSILSSSAYGWLQKPKDK